MITALPWLLAGATASVCVAMLVGGDARTAGGPQKVRDAIILGCCLGIAVALAELVRVAFVHSVAAFDYELQAGSFPFVPIVGLAGLACGVIIGFVVPQAVRTNLVTPFDPITARALRELLREAEAVFNARLPAEAWVFTPHPELGAITPAEAVQYESRATGVWRLLDSEGGSRQDKEARPARADRPVPTVIEGGRK